MGDLASALASAFNLAPPAGPGLIAHPDLAGDEVQAPPRARPAPPRSTTAADIPEDCLSAADRIALRLGTTKSLRTNKFWRHRIAWGLAFGRTCMDCGGRMIFSSQESLPKQVWPLLATIDHIQQQALGGGHGRENLQVICASCNNLRAIQRPGQHPIPARVGTRSQETRREQAALHAYVYLWPHLSWAIEEPEDLS